ncbi:MAG: hypothetical protein HQL37_01650 [Alphaproteobacteria bacterium]|nr:hypothetical protein [Alphaproteobacteria bacterium]
MTWTYDITQLATSPMMQVRFRIGDTLSTEPLVQDEEINLAMAQRGSLIGAAAVVAHAIAARFSRLSDTETGNARLSHSQKAAQYRRLAVDLEALDESIGGAMPYAGGISRSDKRSREIDPDRVRPSFTRGMTDYPVAGGQAPDGGERP